MANVFTKFGNVDSSKLIAEIDRMISRIKKVNGDVAKASNTIRDFEDILGKLTKLKEEVHENSNDKSSSTHSERKEKKEDYVNSYNEIVGNYNKAVGAYNKKIRNLILSRATEATGKITSRLENAKHNAAVKNKVTGGNDVNNKINNWIKKVENADLDGLNDISSEALCLLEPSNFENLSVTQLGNLLDLFKECGNKIK